MTNAAIKPRRKRLLWSTVIGGSILGLALFAAWYLKSPHFRDMVRGRIVGQIEDATGGRVDIARLDWNLSKLEFDLRDVTIHGLEAPNEIPYVHVDRIFVRGKVGSLFHRALGFRYLELDRPIVHLIVYPDGSTNQPTPKVKGEGAGLQTIFEFSINKADVRDGKLLFNDQTMPLDFAASEIAGTLTWFKPANRYDTKIHLGKIDTALEGMRPFATIADAEFSFGTGAAELKSLALVSGRSRLDASGHLDDLRHPSGTVKYRATLNLADAGAIARVPEMRGGILNLEGSGAYSNAGFATAGKLSLREGEWHDSLLHIRNASATSEFSLDQARILLKRVAGQVAGGTASGDLTVENWCAACTKADSTAQQRGTVRLQFTGLSAHDVASVFSTHSLPIEEMRPAGTAAGTVTVSWKGTPLDAVTEIDAAAVPSENADVGELPVTASLRGSYHGKLRVLDVAALSLTTPATHVTASGAIGNTGTNLRGSATTTDLGEFRPLLAAAFGANGLPVELHGQAAFDGVVSGAIAAPTFIGKLQATNFESYVGTLHTAQASTPRQMHWDEFSANIEYGPKLLAVRNGVLRQGRAQVAFDGTAQLSKGDFTKATPFAVQVAIHNTQVSEFQSVMGYSYPVSGTLDLNMLFSGTAAEPRGSGRAQITDAVVYGQPLDLIRSDIAFAKSDARFGNVVVTKRHGRISGAGAYNFESSAYRFNMRGAKIPIEDIKVLQGPRLKTAGTLDFTAEGSGTQDAPSINADLSIANIVVGGEHAGDVTIKARSAGEVMNFTAGASLGDANLALKGTVRTRGDFQTTAVATMSHMDLRPLWSVYSKGRITGRPSLSGQLDLHGSLRQWRGMEVSGNISELFLPVENMQIRNVGALKFAVANEALTLQQFHLSAEDTDVTATGTLEFAGEQKLDMRAEGRVNLKLIQTMNPDFTSYGTATVSVRLAGDIVNPRTVGRVEIANAGVSYIDLPIGLSDMNGSLVFNRDRLQIQTLSARTGGGTLNLAGYATYGKALGFNLLAVGDGIRLRYPQGVSSSANANLKFTGTPTNALLSGDIVITKFGLTPQFDLANYIARSKQPPTLPKPNSMLYNVKMDVHVTSTPELQVQTALAKISGNVDLRVRGSAANPAVLGRVTIVEGDVSFQGTKYRLERGDVTFSNPTNITPAFDVAATTRVRDYDISLGFHGSTDRLTTTYRSDPPLATADIIALLAFGRTREESAQQTAANQNMTEQASNAILGQALNATVSSRMQKLFGVSRIKIDPYVGGAENNPSSARVTIEQQVAKDLTVTYITDLAKSNQQVISMEYNVSRKVSIVAVRDQYGIVSFDVKIRHRKK
jgi:translocation and assembly module TamB